MQQMKTMVREVLVVLSCALVLAPAAIGQARPSERVPEGLTAADWSSITAAYEAGRRATDHDEERGPRSPLNTGSIVQQAYIKAPNSDAKDQFGEVLAMSGDTVVVGASQEDGSANTINGPYNNSILSAGAAYVFVRSGTSWSQQAYLKPHNNNNSFWFGQSVAVDGNTIVVGAPRESTFATRSGAVYVFVRNGTTWSQQAWFKASNPDPWDFFGFDVAISGDTIVAGAPSESSLATGVDGDQSDNSGVTTGAAYVFARSGTTWSQQAYLKASNTDWYDAFGGTVTVLDDDTVVVGAPGEKSNATGIDGDQEDDSLGQAGAAYVFVRQGVTWSQQAYIKASNTDGFDSFALSMSSSRGTLVIGAPYEDSNATGADGDQYDESATRSGAVYVFVRNGTHWSQQTYLKASNTDANDNFGFSVNLSVDQLVVGAPFEASAAVGVNGDQSDNSSPGAGATFLFKRSGESWNQVAYLKASNTEGGDLFGETVAVSENLVAVGAWRESSDSDGIQPDQSDNSAQWAGAAYTFDLKAWTDMGCALAGVSGDPLLVGTGTLAEDSVSAFGLSYAAPSAPCLLFVALSSTPTSFKGGTIKAFPPLIEPIFLVTNPAGTLSQLFRGAPGLPSGTTLWFQFVIQDAAAVFGVSLSNAIVVTTL